MKRYFARLQEKSQALHCMVLESEGHVLLLPSVSIAEICHDLPHGLLTQAEHTMKIDWRGCQLPLYSLGHYCYQQPTDFTRAKHLAIMHCMQPEKSFWAMSLDALPRVVRLEHNDIELLSEQTNKSYLRVKLSEQQADIIDLFKVEALF